MEGNLRPYPFQKTFKMSAIAQELRSGSYRYSHFNLRMRIMITLVVLSALLASPRGVFGVNVSNQQQSNSNGNSSSQVSSNVNNIGNNLLGLSERAAGGLNSRYLSASGTASLAAATAAASANQPSQSVSAALQQQQQQQQQILQQHSQAINSQQHNQQSIQNQQQQQVVATGVPASTNQLNSVGVQQASVASQFLQSPQQLQPQPPLQTTPVMATTYAYNPQTGQLIPSELSAGALLPGQTNGQASGSNLFFGGGQVGGGGGALTVGTFGSPGFPPFQTPINQQVYPPARLYANRHQQSSPFGQHLARPTNSNGFASVAFARRQGVQPSAGVTYATRLNGNSQLYQVDDDSNGLFQQQQVSSGNGLSLADQLAATFGLEPANFGGPSSFQSGGGYSLVGQQPQQQQQFLIGTSQQSEQQQNQAQLGLLPSPTTSFGGALSAGSQQQDYAASATSSASRIDQCVAADGRHGTCYQASECIKRGGTPMGRCGATTNAHSPSSQAHQAQDLLTGSSHVCCLFDVTCGQFAAERFVYFRNPNYPGTFDQSRMCRAKIGKLDKGVCQFRLDMLRFDIGKPTNGNCSQDMFVVSGQNENYVIPKICGLNDGQHYYVGVDESGVITLHMMMMGYAYRRSFEILITQIPCRSDFAAPAHCLQYYMGTHGTIKSFNYDDDAFATASNSPNGGANYPYESQDTSGQQQQFGAQQLAPYGIQFNANNQLQARQGSPILASSLSNRFSSAEFNLGPIQYGGYPNDLDYTICIRKESGFCSITYALSRNDQSGQLSPFAVGSQFFAGANESWHQTTSSGSPGPISTECRDDYLLIGGVRLCSGNGGAGAQLALEQQLPFSNYSNSAAAGQFQQQLQQQANFLMQQLTRLQHQQATANATAGQQTGNALNGNANGNLEQQQAAILQQLMVTQQQLNSLAANPAGLLSRSGQQLEQSFNGQSSLDPLLVAGGSSSTIITDTTSGPFLLRFVSNTARNARGFHIDYRQNPCK